MRMNKKAIAFLSILTLFVSLPSIPVNAAVKAGGACSKAGITAVASGKTFTCIKSGQKLIWNKGVGKVGSTTTAQAQLPQEGTACLKIGDKVFGNSGYMKCIWAGGETEELSKTIFWRFYPITKISTSSSNRYPKTPVDKAACANSGDTFNVSGGILECRWVNGKKLNWIKINSTKKSFVNAKSPVSIDRCKLQNSDSIADKSGRNSGAGVVGFPLINSDKHRMNVNGANEVLIVPVDFPDFPGGSGLSDQLEYDTKWLTDWYNYFSKSQSKFNVTTINRWFRMPLSRSNYPTDGKITSSALANGNQIQGNQAQAFINEITKDIDLRKFSTVYMFFPNGEYLNNDLIVRNHNFKIKEGELLLNFYSWGYKLEAMETLKWSYYIHETLHDFNIIGHAPGNGWPLGMMQNQSGISLALNPYEQFLLGWLPPEQIYCNEVSTLKSETISLTSAEREDGQTKLAIIRFSSTKAIVVEAHGIDKWSSFKFGDRTFPPGFYSIMAYVVDLDKAVAPPVRSDGTSLNNDEWAWAVWQEVNGGPSNKFNLNVGAGKDLANYVAVLGDSFVIEGVRIKVVGTGDYETIEISKIG
jgi:hypothetical protein